MSTPQILTVLFFSWFLVINGLVGALVRSSYKWGFFTFGLVGLFFIWYVSIAARVVDSLIFPFSRYQLLGHVHLFPFRHAESKAGYFIGAAWISFIWMLYPICWGLSEGGNVISPSAEMVFYGILDLMSGPFFLIPYMFMVSTLDDQALGATAFGTTDRGVLEKQPQQQISAPVQQQQPAQQQPPVTV